MSSWLKDLFKPWDGKLDPKVAEFFKEFPQPYRDKVIERYSKREGLHHFDFFRDMDMDNEMRCAKNGVFLEDQRRLKEEQEESSRQALEKEKERRRQEQLQREVPEWEKNLSQYIPLKPEDTMTMKLKDSCLLSLIGIFALWSVTDHIRSRPKWKMYVRITSCIGCFFFAEAVAVSRLFYWGSFREPVDGSYRFSAITKREFEEQVQHIEDFLANLTTNKPK
ncbi:uncharacterized protein LOC131941929 [Physella acuta]|uniref:uncharacterized protein LOC131941929 n=1 Tax=Physella acuta TaxID=109671 RepID=UPI0027DBF3F5|nr:uncharacterized protein LOC131941929 [Physella acuta]XP_059157533.1 uncharacterized protein LOC131941929 [Physella acuta]XP_059157534.1 uncharacterized protein LOC131941929 [Physella acuta]